MSVTLAFGSTVVDLQQGPEWGGQSTLEQALAWEQMSDGRWRVWDKGWQRDVWSCQHTWVIPQSSAASLRGLVQDLARGQVATLTAEDGVFPFGPLVDCSAGIQVRVTASQNQGALPVSLYHGIQLSIVADPHPQVQGKWIVITNRTGMATFLSRATASPSQTYAWGIQPTETAWALLDGSGDAFAASLRTQMNTSDFSSALLTAQTLRGGIINIPAAREPWGPGIAPNDSGTHRARLKAFTWSRTAADLWDFSITAAQEPTA